MSFYNEAMEFFVENGIQLNNNQINILKEFKADIANTYARRNMRNRLSGDHNIAKDQKAMNKDMGYKITNGEEERYADMSYPVYNMKDYNLKTHSRKQSTDAANRINRKNYKGFLRT